MSLVSAVYIEFWMLSLNLASESCLHTTHSIFTTYHILPNKRAGHRGTKWTLDIDEIDYVPP